ncbi:MAG: sn-glycerol-3-phosphate ABC transporter substrate-binding protein UgpB [Alphaproteobacteria bacterium]|nr:MAG: sn-glycerol-3-phosphate ABC transporter substrate-binding protein UgpB [Alphaproteobacteria bacterium]
MYKPFAGLAALAAIGFSAPASAQTELQWWHAMAGELGQKLEKIATDFNNSQKDFKVVPVYKGTYPEVMTGAIAAFRAKQPPHIIQVFEVGTATMMAARGAVYPVYELMKDAAEPFDPKAYLPAVVGYYTDTQGNMLSFPFNSSTPVLYYNKDLFKKAGLDPNSPPKTWPEVGAAAAKLQAAGVPCGFTSEWPSWINIENLSAWHNVPIATQANGFGGFNTELKINGPVQVKHLAQLAEWQKTKLFDYGGRVNSAEPKFNASECGMILASSATRLTIITNLKSEVGIAMMPYWPDVKGTPQNSIIGGATLWVLKGQKAEDYKGVAKFFSYLSKPEVQAWWHQQTGYLPITQAAYELSRQQGFYDKNPGTDVSIKQMTLNPPTDNSKGLRLGSFVQIRNIIEEEMESALQGNKSAQEALDSAVTRGNDLLRQFERANM